MAKLYGRGSIEEIEAGRKYRIQQPCGKGPDTGRYKRVRETFKGAKRQAEMRLEEIRHELELADEIREIGLDASELESFGLTMKAITSLGLKSAREVKTELEKRKAEAAHEYTFAEWCEQYLATREAMGEKRANTYKADRAYSKHLIRGLGDMRLSEIKTSTVSVLYANMKTQGVGATTINQAHKLLKRVMQAALVDELIDRNPVDLVKTPKKPNAKREALTAEQAARIRDITSSGRPTANKVTVFLGLSLGARVGEVLGLEWRHIITDSERPYAYIVQQYLGDGKTGPLKTDDDDNPIGRYVPLDASTVNLLTRWKAEQRTKLNAIGIEQGSNTPVITNELGKFSDRRNFSAWFRDWCVKYGYGRWVGDDGKQIVDLTFGIDDPELYPDCVIEWHDVDGWPCDESGKRYSRSNKRPPKPKRHYDGLVYHELRHTHFTMRLASGTTIPVEQALGGWSTPAMLTEVYLHATPEKVWSEAGFMDEVIASA